MSDLFSILYYPKGDIDTRLFDDVDINTLEEDTGDSFLHCAIASELQELSLYLINRGINVNIQDNNGDTALHFLPVYHNIEIGKAIMKAGGDPNIRNKHNNNSLWTAVFNARGKNYDLVELLLAYGADAHTPNNAGRSPLDFAKQINDQYMIQLMDVER